MPRNEVTVDQLIKILQKYNREYKVVLTDRHGIVMLNIEDVNGRVLSVVMEY